MDRSAFHRARVIYSLLPSLVWSDSGPKSTSTWWTPWSGPAPHWTVPARPAPTPDCPRSLCRRRRALELSRPGTVIVVDYVVREGAVMDSGDDDPAVRGVRRMNELIAEEPRLNATVLQTVGAKGYDGFLLAVVS